MLHIENYLPEYSLQPREAISFDKFALTIENNFVLNPYFKAYDSIDESKTKFEKGELGSSDFIHDFKILFRLAQKPVAILTLIISLLCFLLQRRARIQDDFNPRYFNCTYLRDNDPEKHYKYLVSIHTDMRINAGTSSNVAIRLIGNDKSSEIHHLTSNETFISHKNLKKLRKKQLASQHAESSGNPTPENINTPTSKVMPTIFTKGSINNFILTTRSNLDKIIAVRIWHDSTGFSPEWYLSKVIVKNLENEESFIFLANKWLDVELGDGMIDQILPLSSKTELRYLGHRLYNYFSQNLRQFHPYFSYYYMNPGDYFLYDYYERLHIYSFQVLLRVRMNFRRPGARDEDK